MPARMPRHLLACLALLAASCSRPADPEQAAAKPNSAVPQHSPAEPNAAVPKDSLAKPTPIGPTPYSEPVPELPEARQLCDALHLQPAQRRSACCPTATPTASAGAPADAQARADICAANLSAAVAGGGVVLDDRGLAACMDAITAELADCDWVGPTPPPPPAACAGALHGTLPAESRCKSALECAPGLACVGLGEASPGTCAAAPANASIDVLARDLRITASAARLPSGSPCTTDAECRGACLRDAGTCGPRCDPA